MPSSGEQMILAILFALVANFSAFAAPHPTGGGSPPPAASAPPAATAASPAPTASPTPAAVAPTQTLKACKASDPSTWGKESGSKPCSDADGNPTTLAGFVGASRHNEPKGGHWGCGADETQHSQNGYDYKSRHCEALATAKADNKAIAEAAEARRLREQAEADHGYIAGALRCHEVEVIDGSGNKVSVSRCDAVDEIRQQLEDVKQQNAEQDAEIQAASDRAEAAHTRLDDASATHDREQAEQASRDSRQDATTYEQGEKIATLWGGAHLTGYLDGAFYSLTGGTPVMVGEDEEVFAGATLAYGERGLFGVAGGMGPEWQHFGILASGTVGFVDGRGDQASAVGVNPYLALHPTSTVQLDLGLNVSYIGAGDQLFSPDFSGATSTLLGAGAGPTVAVAIGKGQRALDARLTMLWGQVNQWLVVAVNETGDNVLEEQDASAFIFSVGGRFGGAPQ